MEKVELKGYIEQYLATYKTEADQHNIKAEFICQNDRYPVMLDTKEFKRIFDNLFTNTIKYRNESCSNVRISLKCTSDKKYIQLVFQDDGPGIPQESLGRIFDSFYRVDDSRKNAEKGKKRLRKENKNFKTIYNNSQTIS